MEEPIVNQGDLESKRSKLKDTEEMLKLLGTECDSCKAQAVSAIEVLKQHLDKCIPSVHGQQALSNAFMQVCSLPASACPVEFLAQVVFCHYCCWFCLNHDEEQ